MHEDTYIAVSGGFDPPHIGHIRMMSDAANFGKVIVLLNSDAWLIRKKGYCFMPWEERRELLIHYEFVHGVIAAFDRNETVSESLVNLRHLISYFGKGGDRTSLNTPEAAVCDKFNIPIIYGLGGDKVQSSSELVKNAKN